jgi:hypothetical protein
LQQPYHPQSTTGDNMNKKLASLMFAIGLGVASAPAFASCTYYCVSEYNACIAGGDDPATCQADRQMCLDAC